MPGSVRIHRQPLPGTRRVLLGQALHRTGSSGAEIPTLTLP